MRTEELTYTDCEVDTFIYKWIQGEAEFPGITLTRRAAERVEEVMMDEWQDLGGV